MWHGLIRPSFVPEAPTQELRALAQRGVKAPPEKLRPALQGRVAGRHRFLLRLHLRQVDALDAPRT